MKLYELDRILRSHGVFLNVDSKDADRHSANVTQLVVHLDDGRAPVEMGGEKGKQL